MICCRVGNGCLRCLLTSACLAKVHGWLVSGQLRLLYGSIGRSCIDGKFNSLEDVSVVRVPDDVCRNESGINSFMSKRTVWYTLNGRCWERQPVYLEAWSNCCCQRPWWRVEIYILMHFPRQWNRLWGIHLDTTFFRAPWSIFSQILSASCHCQKFICIARTGWF